MATLESLLRQGGCDRLDLELLAAYVLKQDRSSVLAHPEQVLTPAQSRQLSALIRRRQQHEPIAYILGEKEFFGLSFFVNRHTLIPRPETELLVEGVLNKMMNQESGIKNKKKRTAIVDVGTGSGCITIALARQIKYQKSNIRSLRVASANQDSPFQFFAGDISEEALRMARKNARRHGVQEMIVFSKSNFLGGLKQRLKHFDTVIVVANLPYVSPVLYRKAAPTVKNFEPENALLSPERGLAHYRRLMRHLRSLAKTQKVYFFLEISPEQAPFMDRLIGQGLWEIHPDLAGKTRVVSGHFG